MSQVLELHVCVYTCGGGRDFTRIVTHHAVVTYLPCITDPHHTRSHTHTHMSHTYMGVYIMSMSSVSMRAHSTHTTHTQTHTHTHTTHTSIFNLNLVLETYSAYRNRFYFSAVDIPIHFAQLQELYIFTGCPKKSGTLDFR